MLSACLRKSCWRWTLSHRVGLVLRSSPLLRRVAFPLLLSSSPGVGTLPPPPPPPPPHCSSLTLRRWYSRGGRNSLDEKAAAALEAELVKAADLRAVADSYGLARSLSRRVILHVGPTNSGKTHAALRALAAASSGVYCAPLRLLAQEVYTRLRTHPEHPVPAALRTGQQRQADHGARHLACTVEMCPAPSLVSLPDIPSLPTHLLVDSWSESASASSASLAAADSSSFSSCPSSSSSSSSSSSMSTFSIRSSGKESGRAGRARAKGPQRLRRRWTQLVRRQERAVQDEILDDEEEEAEEELRRLEEELWPSAYQEQEKLALLGEAYDQDEDANSRKQAHAQLRQAENNENNENDENDEVEGVNDRDNNDGTDADDDDDDDCDDDDTDYDANSNDDRQLMLESEQDESVWDELGNWRPSHGEHFAVGVVDEAQLAGDEQRGYAFTRALLGLPVKELHVCGSAAAESLLRSLLELTGESLEVRRYERLAPLHLAAHSLQAERSRLKKHSRRHANERQQQHTQRHRQFARGGGSGARRRTHRQDWTVDEFDDDEFNEDHDAFLSAYRTGRSSSSLFSSQQDSWPWQLDSELPRGMRSSQRSSPSRDHQEERFLRQVDAGRSRGGGREAEFLRHVQVGDAVVAFSRRRIHELKRTIESVRPDLRCCVVYGSLPPETRTQQAALFNDEHSGYDVLVCSDAVGLGLNLNIRRVVFADVRKFDGVRVGVAQPALIAQIAGRAGRFGGRFADQGLVTTLFTQHRSVVEKALRSAAISFVSDAVSSTAAASRSRVASARSTASSRQQVDNQELDIDDMNAVEDEDDAEEEYADAEEDLDDEFDEDADDELDDVEELDGTTQLVAAEEVRAGLAPTLSQLQGFSIVASEMGFEDLSLSDLLDAFVRLVRTDRRFFVCDISDMQELARLIRPLSLPLTSAYHLCCAPVDVSSDECVSMFRLYAERYAAGQRVFVGGKLTQLLRQKQPNSVGLHEHDLHQLEEVHKVLELYQWLALRFPAFEEFEHAEVLKERCAYLIACALRNITERSARGSTTARARLRSSARQRGGGGGSKGSSSRPSSQLRRRMMASEDHYGQLFGYDEDRSAGSRSQRGGGGGGGGGGGRRQKSHKQKRPGRRRR